MASNIYNHKTDNTTMKKLARLQIDIFRYLKNVRYVGIPWDVHLKIYEGYAKRYGYSQSAERIAERGGFGYSEAIEFYPEWDRVVYCTNKWNDDFDQWTKFKIPCGSLTPTVTNHITSIIVDNLFDNWKTGKETPQEGEVILLYDPSFHTLRCAKYDNQILMAEQRWINLIEFHKRLMDIS